MIMSDVNITSTASRVTKRRLGGRWIDDWRPEDGEFWNATGKTIARRNLSYSVFSEHIGFSVWSIWSVLVLFLRKDYGFDAAQKFLLTAAPTLVGALLRLPYTFAVGKFGGRNWTIVGAGLDLVEADHRAIRRSGALIGLAGAIGALGGVLVNLAFRQSFLTLKNGDGAYLAFIAFYVLCGLVTWFVFMRPRPERLLGV
jgi:NNP family nitrate/nitrite transporter-like MFS transporter